MECRVFGKTGYNENGVNMLHTPETNVFRRFTTVILLKYTRKYTEIPHKYNNAVIFGWKDYLTDLQEWVKQKKGLNGKSANSEGSLPQSEDVKNAIEAGYLQRYGNTCTKLVVLIPHTKPLFVGMSMIHR